MRVFLCCDSQDMAFCDELIAVLHMRQFAVALSKVHLSDEHWQREILRSGVLLYVLSDASAKSLRCLRQWHYALENDVRVLVIKITDVALPEPLREAQIVDYLDFVEIGKQIADGMPPLRRDRYATEVTLKMLIVELNDIKTYIAENPRSLPDLPPTEKKRPEGIDDLLQHEALNKEVPEGIGHRVRRMLRGGR
jgi:hypothetical protein